jgi:hypothetical protein
MTISRSELVDLVYRFYPRGLRDIERRHVPPGEPVHDDTGQLVNSRVFVEIEDVEAQLGGVNGGS